MTHIYVDADACPVVAIIERVAKQFAIPVTLLCDTHHVLSSTYGEVRVIDAGRDAVDLALVNLCKNGDVVVTQDYGVAAMALGKGTYVLHQSGMRYTDDNIEAMLFQRHMAQKARRASKKHHFKGPPKRTREDDDRFETALKELLQSITD